MATDWEQPLIPEGVVSTPDRLVPKIIDYLKVNPIPGLRAPLRLTEPATWALVPLFVLVTLTLGFWTGRLEPELPPLWQVFVLPIVLIFLPSLVEEFFFRGVLLPRSLLSAGTGRRFLAVTASTALFVAVHPISPLIGRSDSDFFLDPWMLVVVAVLGYTLGYAYLRSGSLRAPILIHWITVVVWNLFFGGVY